MRVESAGLLASTLLVASCLAVENSETANSLRVDRSVLTRSVFRTGSHERLLIAAMSHITGGDYSAAFDALRELFRQPSDSSRPVPDSGPVQGTRRAALQFLSRLPLSVRREWDLACQVSGTAALNKALRTSSRVALIRVAAEFPFSSVAADALITETIVANSGGQSGDAHRALRELQDLASAGVLTRVQNMAFRQLSNSIHAGVDSHRAATSVNQPAFRSAHAQPNWKWTDNSWRHGEWPDAVSLHGFGSQPDHRSGWQRPVLHGGSIITRTPVGIVSLERVSGEQQWFLPCRSVAAPARDTSAMGAIFDFMSEPSQRLESSGDLIFFTDGRRDSRMEHFYRDRSSPEIGQGATHLVAVRTGCRPIVLWEVRTDVISRISTDGNASDKIKDFRYAFALTKESDSSTAQHRYSRRPTLVTEHRLAGHLFLSVPRAHAGRLYLTTRYDGVTWLNCLSATHGTLYWQQPLTWLGSNVEDDPSSAAVVGAITDDTVVCLFGSGLIAGCRPIDGRIEWIQSVDVIHESPAEFDDFWLAAQADRRFVPQTGVGSAFGDLWLQPSPTGMILSRRGSQRIYCLNAANGEIQWTCSRGVEGGTAADQYDMTCIGLMGSQLITIGYGHCRAISVTNGSQTWVRPLGNHDGRICFDQHFVYVGLNSGRVLTIDGENGVLLQSEQLNLSGAGSGFACDSAGIVAASAWSVQSWKWRDDWPTELAPDVDTALDSLVAHRLREQRLLIPHLIRPEFPNGEECVAVAAAGPLSKSQQLKLALLAPDLSGHRAFLAEQLHREPDQIVQLLPGWDLPLSTVVHMLGLSRASPGAGLDSGELTLFPARSAPMDSRLEAANALINRNRLSEAELLLLNTDVARNTSQAGRRNELLRQARGSALDPGIIRADPMTAVTAVFDDSLSQSDDFRFSDIAAIYRRFHSRIHAVVPSWSRFLFVTNEGRSFHVGPINPEHVGLIDLSRGIVTDQASTSVIHFAGNVTSSGDWSSPGLVVVRGRRHIGVTSLLNESPLSPLWLRRRADDATGEVIALTSRQLIISSGAGLQSLHPLTGQLQWSRDWKQSRQLAHLEGQYFKVYCSNRYVILLSSLGTGYVVLRAVDGSLVRVGSRPVGQLSRVIGEYLLTRTAESRLELTHLATGKQVPVELNGQAVVSVHPAGEIGEGIAFVITAAAELMLLDVSSGQVKTRVLLPASLKERNVASLSAQLIRRAGLVCLALSAGSWRSPYMSESVFGEAVPGQGVLICIDPHTCEELWQRELNSAVISTVFGDPCPFLVLWSHRDAAGQGQFRFSGGRQNTRLEFTVLDAFTGDIVAATDRQMADRPLQVFHDAQRQQLKIMTEHSTIRMDYSN